MKKPGDKTFTAQMLEIKARYGEPGEIPFEYIGDRLSALRKMWEEQRKTTRSWSWPPETNHIGDLVPVGLVTIMEVVARRWIATLIDHGEPYLENARELTKGPGFELDFAGAKATLGGKLSLGEMIGHSLSINRFEQIEDYLTKLLNERLRDVLMFDGQDRHSPFYFRDPLHGGESEKDWPYASLKRMFFVRHILVHELPERVPYQEHEIDLFLGAVSDFVMRLTDKFRPFIYGTKTLTEELLDVEAEVDRLNKAVAAGYEHYRRANAENARRLQLMERSQKAWETFVEAECEQWSNNLEGFSSASHELSFVLAHHRRRLLVERLKAFPSER